MIPQALAGRRIAVTGATGFLGTALVERLLRAVPGCEVVVIVRPGRRNTAADRTRRDILRNDCFDRLRSEWGAEFDATISRRLITIAGDVATDGLGLDDEGRAILSEADVVIHSAASVSFDSPLDSAVEVNLLGPSRVAAVLNELAASKDRAPSGADSPGPEKAGAEPTHKPPHLIAVSTAYVAGKRRGKAYETLLPDTHYATEADWRAEVSSARRLRDDLGAESRRPAQLKVFSHRARSELGGAGVPLLAERTEKIRSDWVRDQLVQAGRARALALGWPDAYAFTKAMGERALLENRGDLDVTIVRPSIIESALAEPAPGWIRGFRMAEPVIISYARGLLREFPGVPEGIIDVIPVDLVVAAIIAVAAHGSAPEGPSVYHVASGGRNPLRYRALVDLVRAWFTEHPLYDSEGQPIVVPDWSFPGRGRVQRQLNQASRALEVAEKVVAALPLRGRGAEVSARMEERRGQVERAKGYVELYGSYTETEAIYQVERLIELSDGLVEADRRAFCFDPGVIDWPTYVSEIHLPSVVVHARVRTEGGKRSGLSREERGRRAVLDPARHMAVFDLENTLIASNVVESYSWLATRHLGLEDRVRFTASMLRKAPALLALDRRDRGDFLRHFYRRYEDAPAARLEADAWEMFSDMILSKSFPAGFRRVREHRALGHRTLLITGALDLVIEPLKPLFDDIVCASLGRRHGRLTGEMADAPPTGEARALVMAEYARANGLSLEESVAYADSASDLPMLEAVGHPVAVNPEAKLATIARKRGWHTERWSKAPGHSRLPLPMGPRP
ncbi:MAG: HAD-IB family phosphatase [Acidimicrobiales bacterium]